MREYLVQVKFRTADGSEVTQQVAVEAAHDTVAALKAIQTVASLYREPIVFTSVTVSSANV